ncbi:MAG: hypothetical protein WD100_10030 [Tistlia sp.]|uniref:hypothetical protein n=1 Tax=Tistlia sp. TaxID=3057121 RepID=UPI0034A58C78
MDRIEQLAEFTILRALAYVALAIVLLMTGLSYDPLLCFRAGAVLCMLTAVVLAFRAWEAPTRSIRSTELYILLDGDFGMPAERAQRYAGGVLRRLYARFAWIAGGFATSFWLVSLAVRLL